RWRFQEPEGWRRLVEEEAADARRREVLVRVLAGFASSATYRELAAAAVCHREVEFLLDWPPDDGLFPPDSRWLLRGVLDVLWQGGGGAWRLLGFNTETLRPRGRQADWRVRRAGLALASLAVQRQFGCRPADVMLYYLAHGQAIRRSAERLCRRSVFETVDA